MGHKRTITRSKAIAIANERQASQAYIKQLEQQNQILASTINSRLALLACLTEILGGEAKIQSDYLDQMMAELMSGKKKLNSIAIKEGGSEIPTHLILELAEGIELTSEEPEKAKPYLTLVSKENDECKPSDQTNIESNSNQIETSEQTSQERL